MRTKMSIVFGTGLSTNYIAWNRAKYDQILKPESSCFFLRNNKRARCKFKLRKHWQKPMTAELKNELRCWHEHLSCWKRSRKKLRKKIRNFEDEANDMQLGKEDTQRSNLNYSKYLSVTLVLKYPVLLFVFIVFNKLNCKVRSDIGVWRDRLVFQAVPDC